jgi:hypothetical protein
MVKSGIDGKYCPYSKNIVEVSYYIVGVME